MLNRCINDAIMSCWKYSSSQQSAGDRVWELIYFWAFLNSVKYNKDICAVSSMTILSNWQQFKSKVILNNILLLLSLAATSSSISRSVHRLVTWLVYNYSPFFGGHSFYPGRLKFDTEVTCQCVKVCLCSCQLAKRCITFIAQDLVDRLVMSQRTAD